MNTDHSAKKPHAQNKNRFASAYLARLFTAFSLPSSSSA
jgi:hypothetical protein